MRFHCATVLVVWSICPLGGNIVDDAIQVDVNKSLYSFYTTKEMPHVTVTITKNASLAAIARYISITTIYTVGYLQNFTAGHFFSSMQCYDLKRKKHWISMVFNKTQIMALFYWASKAAPSWYIQLNQQLNMFLKVSRGDCPVALPLIAVSTTKTCQHHLETRAAKVWDLVQSDQWNLATQTGQLSRPVCWHDYGQTY